MNRAIHLEHHVCVLVATFLECVKTVIVRIFSVNLSMRNSDTANGLEAAQLVHCWSHRYSSERFHGVGVEMQGYDLIVDRVKLHDCSYAQKCIMGDMRGIGRTGNRWREGEQGVARMMPGSQSWNERPNKSQRDIGTKLLLKRGPWQVTA